MNSSTFSTIKDYDKQLFNITSDLISTIRSHREVWGNESHDYFLSKIYELEQEWHKIFMQSCFQGGF